MSNFSPFVPDDEDFYSVDFEIVFQSFYKRTANHARAYINKLYRATTSLDEREEILKRAYQSLWNLQDHDFINIKFLLEAIPVAAKYLSDKKRLLDQGKIKKFAVN